MTPSQVIEERRFTLIADGDVVARGTCSPYALHALAAGRLLAEGFLAVETVAGRDIITSVVNGGPLTSHTGVQQAPSIGHPAVPPRQMSPGLQLCTVLHASPSLPSPSAAPGIAHTKLSNAA